MRLNAVTCNYVHASCNIFDVCMCVGIVGTARTAMEVINVTRYFYLKNAEIRNSKDPVGTEVQYNHAKSAM